MTNKERILAELLNGERSTGQLCKALGYVKDGIPQYKVIEKDLKTLYSRGLLSRRKGKTGGRPGTFWGIKANLSNLRNILDRYPALGKHIQNSDLVLNTIIEAYAPVYGIHLEIRKHWKGFFYNALRLSWNFFKLHLSNDPKEFSGALINWFKEYEPHTRIAFYLNWKIPELQGDFFIPERLIKELFERCIFIDFIDGKANDIELEYRKLDSEDIIRTEKLFERQERYFEMYIFFGTFHNLFKEPVKKEIQTFFEKSKKEFFELIENNIVGLEEEPKFLKENIEFFAKKTDELEKLLFELNKRLEFSAQQ